MDAADLTVLPTNDTPGKPVAAAESFEPLTGGMAVALAHVGTFLSGHNLRALNDVMGAIAAAGGREDRGTLHRARITGAA